MSVELTATRYTATPFPPYRFRPGRHPHPTANPQGHSYLPPGAAHPEVRFRTAEQWRDSEDYLYGCDLYNHAYWWEAHEAWEGLWQLTDKRGFQGQFLQTVIQVSAAHLKLSMGRLEGVRSLLESSRGHGAAALSLAGCDEIMGLNLRLWYGRVEAYFAARLAEAVPAHDPVTYPFVVLPLGPDHRPGDRRSGGAGT
jgi:hypothetical protein